MIRLVVAVLIPAVLLGGCSSETLDTPAPPPRADTVQELKDALPTENDVAGARKVTSTCPDDGAERCGARVSEGQLVSRFLELFPVTGTSGADVERAEKDTLLDDIVVVNAWKHESVAAAKKAVAKFREEQGKYEGSYDIEQEQGEGRVAPGLKGTGKLEPLTVETWEGLLSSRRGTMSFNDQTEGRLGAEATVRSGAYTVFAAVDVLSDGRSAEFAEKLVLQVLGDYLTRLG